MTIAEQIRANQNEQHMTWQCIRTLKKLGADTADLECNFARIYGITVEKYGELPLSEDELAEIADRKAKRRARKNK